MNLDEAFELRETIKKMPYAEKYVIEGILRGDYDRYKLEAQNIAREDVDFLSNEQKTTWAVGT